MVLVENLARRRRIEAILGDRGPGDVQHPVDIGADHLVFGRGRRHPLEPIDLARGDAVNRLGQVGGLHTAAKFLRLGLLAFAQLVLDGLQLLAQEVLPLGVGHLLLRGCLDLALELEERDLAVQGGRHRLQLRDEGVVLEDLLLLLGLQIEKAREQIREPQRIVDAGHHAAQFLREPGPLRQRAPDQIVDAAHVRVGLDRALDLLRRRLHRRAQHLAAERHHVRTRARQAFDDDVDAAIRHFRHLPDRGDCADLLQLIGLRLLVLGRLQGDEQQPIARQRAVDRFDRHRPRDRDRLERQRKHDGVAEGEDGKLGRVFARLVGWHTSLQDTGGVGVGGDGETEVEAAEVAEGMDVSENGARVR